MGIKGLNQFLNQHCQYTTISYDHFKDSYIAIDTGIVLYTLTSKAIKMVLTQTNLYTEKLCRKKVINVLLKLTSNFIHFLKSHDITPIFVFDGKAAPEKEKELLKRYRHKQNKKERIDYLYSQSYKNVKELKKLLTSYLEFTQDEKDLYKRFIKSLKIMCVDALGEAEKLCASMCIDGYVKGVFTLDTDIYAYGCPLIITSFEQNGIKCIEMRHILNQLKWTQSMFVDFCILCGCDYNRPATDLCKDEKLTKDELYQLLFKYHTIEQLPFTIDLRASNYKYCRDEYKYVTTYQLINVTPLLKH